MEARDEAEVEDVPGAECSVRIVVRGAIQVLVLLAFCMAWLSGRQRTRGGSSGVWMRRPCWRMAFD